jgi:hypothetical protein
MKTEAAPSRAARHGLEALLAELVLADSLKVVEAISRSEQSSR